jgi:hypothetical protein
MKFEENDKREKRGEWDARAAFRQHFEPTRPFGHGISNPTPYQARRPPLGMLRFCLNNNIVANPLSERTRGGFDFKPTDIMVTCVLEPFFW